MDDPILNCLTTACCPPEARAGALSAYLIAHGIDTPERFAEFLFKHFDLAPVGTLTPLVAEVARLARGEDWPR